MSSTSDEPARFGREETMEAMAMLAEGIAHDFSNHLLAMTTFAEAALREAPQDSTQRHDLTRLLAATEKAQALVTEILAFSRTADPAPASTDERPGGRVLYCESQPILAKVGRRMIADLGYGVEAFPSCEHALSAFRKDPGRFQFALLDDACDPLAAEIRASRPELPIVLCVSGGAAVDGSGDRAILEKPFSLRELAAALQRG